MEILRDPRALVVAMYTDLQQFAYEQLLSPNVLSVYFALVLMTIMALIIATLAIAIITLCGAIACEFVLIFRKQAREHAAALAAVKRTKPRQKSPRDKQQKRKPKKQ